MTTLYLALVLSLHPGDQIVWGENSNCQGLILSIREKLLEVKGVCQVPYGEGKTVPILVQDYISINDVKKVIK